MARSVWQQKFENIPHIAKNVPNKIRSSGQIFSWTYFLSILSTKMSYTSPSVWLPKSHFAAKLFSEIIVKAFAFRTKMCVAIKGSVSTNSEAIITMLKDYIQLYQQNVPFRELVH